MDRLCTFNVSNSTLEKEGDDFAIIASIVITTSFRPLETHSHLGIVPEFTSATHLLHIKSAMVHLLRSLLVDENHPEYKPPGGFDGVVQVHYNKKTGAYLPVGMGMYDISQPKTTLARILEALDAVFVRHNK